MVSQGETLIWGALTSREQLQQPPCWRFQKRSTLNGSLAPESFLRVFKLVIPCSWSFLALSQEGARWMSTFTSGSRRLTGLLSVQRVTGRLFDWFCFGMALGTDQGSSSPGTSPGGCC